MVSSLFSRRPVVQQPPPVCKSKLPPPIIIPPPPPTHNSVRLDVTWAGIDQFSVFHEEEESVLLRPNYPTPPNVYTFSRGGPPNTFEVILLVDAGNLTATYEWNYPTGGKVAASINQPIDPDVPIDTGIQTAFATNPFGQDSTYRFYSTYTPP